MPRLSPIACAALATVAHAQTAPPTTRLPEVDVVVTTPVPGTGTPRDQIPSNVQTAGAKRLRETQSLNLPEFMLTQLPSVNVNEMQGNPYQMDVNYRGFSASPLLGTAQGLSVFQDGVRVNEPFGDVVNWDLIPRAALASVTLLPGSNPLFGLNTLGGALSLQTKSGDTDPGTELEFQAGSFGRISTELTHGRALGNGGHLFLAFSGLNEDGWRDFSPSRVRQLFGKAGRRSAGLSWEVALTHADNRLIGNGPLPEAMLAQRRNQVYTVPDITANEMTLLSLNARLALGAGSELAATAYVRHARSSTLNGDLNDDYDPPGMPLAGVENRGHTRQRGDGLALQWNRTLATHALTLGASVDRARSRFEQTQAQGDLDANRAVVPAEDARVDALISGHSRTLSVYASDRIALAPTLQLTLSARANDTSVTTVDDGRAQLGLPTQLDGVGRYRKLNPAAGLTWQLVPAVTAYGSVSQGNRAPSPIELGCSDPANACVLPNALQSDPPLKQVVSRTFEAGLRGGGNGSGADALRWNVSVFRTVNQDDLLFISNGLASGYFSNFGRTLRQGLEASIGQQRGRLNWSASYSYLRATFDSAACIVAAANSNAEASAACPGDDEIEVRPGNRLPGLPAHSLKLSADWQALPDWRLGAQWRGYSGQFVRGNENNAHRPDGVAFDGSGRIGGYAVLDLTTSWHPHPDWELFAKLANAFDRRYASAGLLGHNAFDAAGALLAPDDRRQAQFVAPGAPRAAWVGLRLAF